MSNLVSKVVVDGSECEKVVYSGSTAKYNTISLKDAFYGLWRESSASSYDIETEILLKDKWGEDDKTYKVIFPTKQLVTFNIKVNLNFSNLILYDGNSDIYFSQCWNVWKKSTQCGNLMYYYDSKKLELRCFYANFSASYYNLYETFKLVTKNTDGEWVSVKSVTISDVNPPYEIAFGGSVGTITVDADKVSNFLTVAKTLNNSNHQLYNSYKISCKLNSYIYSKEDIPDEAVQDIKLCYSPYFTSSNPSVPKNGILTFPQDDEKTGFAVLGIDSLNLDYFYIELKVVKLVNYYYCEFDTSITDDRFILNNGCVFFKHRGLFYLIKSVDLQNSVYYYCKPDSDPEYYRYDYVSHNTNSISVSYSHNNSDDSPIGDNFNIDFSNTTLSVLINNISLINNRENCLHESHMYVN